MLQGCVESCGSREDEDVLFAEKVIAHRLQFVELKTRLASGILAVCRLECAKLNKDDLELDKLLDKLLRACPSH